MGGDPVRWVEGAGAAGAPLTTGAEGAPRLNGDALAALASYGWPGNVRQLRNELERIVALHGAERGIPLELLSPAVRGELRD